MEALGKGTIEFEKCNLKEVLFVPKLSTNLMSVNSITKNGGEVIFTKDEVIIKVKNKVIIKGKKTINGLFKVNLKPKKNEESFLIQKNECKVTSHSGIGNWDI